MKIFRKKQKAAINEVNSKEIEELKRQILEKDHKISSLTEIINDITNTNNSLEELIDAFSLISSSLDKNEVLTFILESIAKVLNAEVASIFLLDEINQELVLEASTDIDVTDESKKIRVPIGSGLSGYVAKTGEKINIKDASQDERFYSKADQNSGFKTRSYLCVPIQLKDKIIGTAQVMNKILTPFFTETDEEIFETLSNQSATAIVNSVLYTQIMLNQDKIRNRNDKLLNVAYTSVDLIDNIIKSVERIKSIGTLSQKASNASIEGFKSISTTINEMKNIADLSHETKKVVDLLFHNTLQIGNFLKSINDIADKTNVLSINAAIEAARAGEKGKGFSVVVDEVRKLSQKTAKATQEISEIVNSIKVNSQLIFSSIDREIKEIEVGIKLVNQSGYAINEIQSVVDDMLISMAEIQELNEKQNDAAQRLMKNVGEVDIITDTMSYNL